MSDFNGDFPINMGERMPPFSSDYFRHTSPRLPWTATVGAWEESLRRKRSRAAQLCASAVRALIAIALRFTQLAGTVNAYIRNANHAQKVPGGLRGAQDVPAGSDCSDLQRRLSVSVYQYFNPIRCRTLQRRINCSLRFTHLLRDRSLRSFRVNF